ncbi:hypothetical protein DL546_004893 [Coniochaeta pulveracea]|uniref:Beta-galactosidase n=1 Tax=Coniochaeta pulveracea TaxID=177199 RepID=A0A420Y791_9PEZI|nr:hypothetical protein DL546_004893 [Coniochaeta pulveracea]
MKLLTTLAVTLLTATQGCSALRGRPHTLLSSGPEPRALLQDIVTWDNHSLLIHGERTYIFSGEIHPFRLPVPSLWSDVLEKIKALGLNTISVYIDWALLEGKPGEFRSEGVFDYAAFFEVAKQVGLYVIARPGPYINAEVSGGGFPGWLQRVKGHLRTTDEDYLHATNNYASHINSIIAKYQITNGGPVILYQPENEYSGAIGVEPFPQPEYMQYVEGQARQAGIVVPFISNDAYAGGHNAPGTGVGEVDIYGHDGYPLGFDCANPSTWPAGALPTSWYKTHMNQSASTPYSIPEFQGGSFDPWGGWGFEQCLQLVNHEQVRVFYKNNYAAGVTIFNLYMIFGGTNWGNLGHAGGYTSYDYAAAIKEDRTVAREKYSELKLEAQFMKASPGFLVATPGLSNETGLYSPDTSVTVTPVTGPNGSFFVVRHTDYQSTASTSYTLMLSTSSGQLTVPQLGGKLTLGRRDSKIHVSDYPLGKYSLLYSTAEIFTWQKYENKTVLVVYGGADELHELAIKTAAAPPKVEGEGVTTKAMNGSVIAQWKTTPKRRILQVGDLYVHILDRNSAYNYWVPELAGSSPLIVNGGYLVRSASVSSNTLDIRGDFNSSTSLEIIGVPNGVSKLTLNGASAVYTSDIQGSWLTAIAYNKPKACLPNLSKLEWKSVDSLPEVKSTYDDSAWPNADHTTTNNTFVEPFQTDVSLYGSDYGFHAGVLLFRGHFTATGEEKSLALTTQGGSAFASSVYLNSTFIGSWTGIDAATNKSDTYTLPSLTKGKNYVFTILVDNMGLDENWVVGVDQMKLPRGILHYNLTSTSGTSTPIKWKITGNLGGESYVDKSRGPLNEGGLFHERQGLHLPSAPASALASSNSSSPYAGLASPGVAFYTATLPLHLPSEKFDIPLSFVFSNSTTASSPSDSGAYRAWLYVNGWQFGRYVSNVGPQKEFPVPEGILNHDGDNWIGVAVWALEEGGAKVPGLDLRAGVPVLTAREKVSVVKGSDWEKREGAY